MHKQSQVLAQYGLGEVKYRDPAVSGAVAKQEAAVITSDMTGPVRL